MTEIQRDKNSFFGLSSLREKEKVAQGRSEKAQELDNYLSSKYASSGAEGGQKKKKKKKHGSTAQPGVRIHDLDNTGFHDVSKASGVPHARNRGRMPLGEEEEEEDAPVVANPGEALRLQQVAAREKAGASAQGWQAAEQPTEPAAKRARHDSPDMSPPRRAAAPGDLALRKSHNSLDASASQPAAEPDLSPPRGRPAHRHPPSTSLAGSPGDSSPPRRPQAAAADLSPPRARRRQGLPSQKAPSTSGRPPGPAASGAGDDADMSPPRRAPQSRDLSPPRNRRLPSDQPESHSRRSPRRAEAAVSPPRRRPGDPSADLEPPRRRRHSPGQEDARPGQRERVMADGQRAGLVMGHDLQAHLQAKKAAEKAKFDALGVSATGQGAATTYRDAQGRKVDLEELQRQQQAEQAAKKPKAEPPEWGRGIAQMHQSEQRQEERRREAAKPFARTRDDAELEASLRERTRFGDPMAGLVKRPVAAQLAPAIPEHMLKRMKKSGFLIPQEVPAHSWLSRRMGPPANRYGIRPGRHWDGVDRSTGFEQNLFKQKNEQAQLAQEARMWAQADM